MIATPKLFRVPAALLAIACIAAFGGAPTEAAPKPPAPHVRPLLAFDETYTETPDTESGTLRVDARIPLEPADVAGFDEGTYFYVNVGYFSFDGMLGDDPDWKPGKRTATLTERAWDDSGDVLVATLSWTKNRLTVRVTAVTGDDIDPIMADDYSMDDTGRIEDETDAEIMFGSADVWWNSVPCTGRVRTWATDDDDFSSVRMRGRGLQ